MRFGRTTQWFGCALALLVFSVAASAQQPGNLILQVPDWNQPGNYGVVGYPSWCSPTAGGNLMGYWEDVMGCTGLTDQQAFNAGPGYPGTPGTWEQGLYHDGMIEMGWFMDTGTWQSSQGGGAPKPFPPNAGSTFVQNILPGLLGYATASWTDNDYPAGAPAPGTGIVKAAWPNATGFIHNINMVGAQITLQQMWTTYCGEIDSVRPIEVTFDHWVDASQLLGTVTINGFPNESIEKYPWDLSVDPHSVVGVGYIDISPGFQNNGTDEWFVCQDGWQTTGQYVAVPLDSMWQQNDYITDIPEPATMALLAMGGAIAMLRRRRGRRV